jgi:23S rRNA pseudouridine1911/1915/1917 synthase
MDVKILHEDASWIILDKPAGLLTHQDDVPRDDILDLKNILLKRFPELESVERGGMVHRLDKDTTGVMVFARNQQSYDHLKRQFQEKSNYRMYTALLDGALKEEEIIVETHIERYDDRFRVCDSESGRWAKSKFTLKEILRDHFSLVEVQLATGRTHQIRVHAQYLQRPIVGDKKYNPHSPCSRMQWNDTALTQALKSINRQMLHATELGLEHPQTGKKMLFSSHIPEDMSQLLGVIRS